MQISISTPFSCQKEEELKETMAIPTLWKSEIYLPLLCLILFFSPSLTQPTTRYANETSFCGKIRIQSPFSLQQQPSSSLLNQMLLCKSQKLYFRTTLGLFLVSSVDYRVKTITISHSSCSSSSHFVSPSHLTAGFPSPPQPNSLLLFNCNYREREQVPSAPHNCSNFFGCRAQEQPFPCLFLDDYEKLEVGFYPEGLNCSHYRRIYRSSLSAPGFEFGTRVSYGIPDHVPNVCDECSKQNGNCGIGLRCICHPKECKDKVISKGISTSPLGSIIFLLVSLVVMIILG